MRRRPQQPQHQQPPPPVIRITYPLTVANGPITLICGHLNFKYFFTALSSTHMQRVYATTSSIPIWVSLSRDPKMRKTLNLICFGPLPWGRRPFEAVFDIYVEHISSFFS